MLVIALMQPPQNGLNLPLSLAFYIFPALLIQSKVLPNSTEFKMKQVNELMAAPVHTLPTGSNLQDAEQLMGSKQIRHLPIVNADNQVIGLLTQREFLAEAFRITDRFGAQNLKAYLAKTPVEQCMNTDINSIGPNSSLKEAAQLLLKTRIGCVLITDEQQQLLGIISSKDFVRLSIELLD